MKKKKYTKLEIESDDPVERVMPLVEDLLDHDIIPLIRQVLIKRIGLYLEEIKQATGK